MGYIPFGLFYCNEGFEEPDEVDEGFHVIGTSLPNSEISGKKLELGNKLDSFKKVRDEFLQSVREAPGAKNSVNYHFDRGRVGNVALNCRASGARGQEFSRDDIRFRHVRNIRRLHRRRWPAEQFSEQPLALGL